MGAVGCTGLTGFDARKHGMADSFKNGSRTNKQTKDAAAKTSLRRLNF